MHVIRSLVSTSHGWCVCVCVTRHVVADINTSSVVLLFPPHPSHITHPHIPVHRIVQVEPPSFFADPHRPPLHLGPPRGRKEGVALEQNQDSFQ